MNILYLRSSIFCVHVYVFIVGWYDARYNLQILELFERCYSIDQGKLYITWKYIWSHRSILLWGHRRSIALCCVFSKQTLVSYIEGLSIYTIYPCGCVCVLDMTRQHHLRQRYAYKCRIMRTTY